MDGYPRRKYKMTVGILNEKWNACLLLMLLQNEIVFLKMLCMFVTLSKSICKYTKQKQAKRP
jgi:hypothetical protein